MRIVKRTDIENLNHLIFKFAKKTILEVGSKAIMISTVGNGTDPSLSGPLRLGYNRYYETMVFPARFECDVWMGSMGSEISFDSKWEIDRVDENTDQEATEMHECVVTEIFKKMIDGWFE
jgi:hypothetical protein